MTAVFSLLLLLSSMIFEPAWCWLVRWVEKDQTTLMGCCCRATCGRTLSSSCYQMFVARQWCTILVQHSIIDLAMKTTAERMACIRSSSNSSDSTKLVQIDSSTEYSALRFCAASSSLEHTLELLLLLSSTKYTVFSKNILVYFAKATILNFLSISGSLDEMWKVLVQSSSDWQASFLTGRQRKDCADATSDDLYHPNCLSYSISVHSLVQAAVQ